MSETIDGNDLGYRFYEERVYKNGVHHVYGRNPETDRLEHISHHAVLRAHGYGPDNLPPQELVVAEREEPIDVKEGGDMLTDSGAEQGEPARPYRSVAEDFDEAERLDELDTETLGRRVEESAAAARWAHRKGKLEAAEEARAEVHDLTRRHTDKLDYSNAEANRRIGLWDHYIESGEVPEFRESDVIVDEGVSVFDTGEPTAPPPETTTEARRRGLRGWWNRMGDRYRGSEVRTRVIHARNGNHLGAVERDRYVADRRRSFLGGLALTALGVAAYVINRKYVGFDIDPGIFDNDGMAWSDIPGEGTGSDTGRIDVDLDDPNASDIDVDEPDAASGDNPDIPNWLENKTERDYETLNNALREDGMESDERRRMIEHMFENPAATERVFNHPEQFQDYLDWVDRQREAHDGRITDQQIAAAWEQYFRNLRESS
jgi:hypothetical protein